MQNRGSNVCSCAIALLFACFFFSPSISAHGQERKALPARFRNVVTNLTPNGRLDTASRLHLAIGLPLRNREALTNLLQDLYDPASPRYHQYLTTEQFTEQFGPSEADYQKVIQFAQSNGLTIDRSYRNRMLVDVTGSVGDVEKAFQVALRTYQHPKESRMFYAADVTPTVPVEISVMDVTGLDDYVLPHPMDLHPYSATNNAQPLGNGSFYGIYMSVDLRAAYAPGTPLDGTGQSVGILTFDGYYTNDIAEYKANCGIPDIMVTNVLLDGFNGAAGGNNLETALDIEMAIGMATNLTRVIVYEGVFGDSIYNQMVVDNVAKQLSSSWSFPISGSTGQELQEMKAQGQVMFQASGDSGSWGTWTPPTPIDEPDLIIVGGTWLSTTGPGGAWVSETTWHGSGGGYTDFLMPDWQTNVNMTTNQGSTSRRNIPDVAMVSAEVYMVGNNGGQYGIGGTSVSAPMWAGFCALINQQEAINDNPPVGFLNPIIYPLGLSTNYSLYFHDITTGNNTNSTTPTNFFAVPGYDLCTGWGTPTGTNLINALAPFFPLRVSPPSGLATSGLAGGSFSPASQTFSISNATATTLNWTLLNKPIWLDVLPAGGALNSTSAVTVAPTVIATFLPAGTYMANLLFKDNGSGLAQSRPFTLTVNPQVSNGGFETANVSSWTTNGSANQATVISGDANFVHSGSWGARLANVGTPLGTLAQTVPTTAGQTYLLSFWLGSGANPNPPKKTTPNEFSASWNGTTLFDQANIGVIGWTNLQFYVTATGNSSVIQFGFRDDPYALGLDDISLQPVVSPASQGITKSNGMLLLNWGSVAGLKYQVQYKTNLLQATWSNIGNVITPTNLIFTTTNSFSANPQRFYRLLWVP